MTDLANLAERMRLLGRYVTKRTRGAKAKIPGAFNTIDRIAGTALVVLDNVIELTPVDTGRAVSNWQIWWQGKSDTEIEPYYPGEKGSTRINNVKAAKHVARIDLTKWDGQNELHVINPVDYIIYLNEGTATRAGLFFIERAIASGEVFTRRFK